MRFLFALLAAGLLVGPAHAQLKEGTSQIAPAAPGKADSVAIRRLYDEALLRGQSYDNLRYLCQQIGPRLSGSAQAARAVEWGKLTIGRLKMFFQLCQLP